MHITHLSENDLDDPDARSGTPFWVTKGLGQTENIDLYKMYINPERLQLPLWEEALFKCKSYFYRYFKQAHLSPGYSTRHALNFAKNINPLLNKFKTDAILTTVTPYTAAFLEIRKPLIFWTDAIYAGLSGFYPHCMMHHPDVMLDAYEMTNACLLNAKQLIFSSEWCARSAIELHGIAKNKIQIVPFGANLDIKHTLTDVKEMVASRLKQKSINMLFIGKQWYRKGGDIVLRIVEALNKAGHPTRLTIVGCNLDEKSLPEYVTCLGMLSKKSPKDLAHLQELYQNAHFLFVPSRAEAFGIVFCEANSFGVPNITTYVGGIPEIVKDNINGMKFSLEATVANYCDYIINIMSNPDKYTELALSSFHEYETRLNWQVSSEKVRKIISDAL